MITDKTIESGHTVLWFNENKVHKGVIEIEPKPNRVIIALHFNDSVAFAPSDYEKSDVDGYKFKRGLCTCYTGDTKITYGEYNLLDERYAGRLKYIGPRFDY